MVLRISDLRFQELNINLTLSTSFMPLVCFRSPWKHQESSGFQGVEKETTGMEWGEKYYGH